MRLGAFHACGVPIGAIAAVAAASAPISAVAADGWQATMIVPAELTLSPISVLRQGFDGTGAAREDIVETLYATKRVRKAYPLHGELTTSSVALSDYVYATDTIAGVANNSTETSPKPISDWIVPDRATVANSIDWELVAFHRNGVACVEVRATDGTNTTAWQRVAVPTVSGRSWDKNAVTCYSGTLDISSLANLKVITLQRRVVPRIGTGGSILDSGDAGSPYSPATLTFWKDTTLAASPYYAYVAKAADAPNGIGTPTSGGAVSASLATAKATPFDTIANAVTGINTLRGASGVDACIVMLGNDAGTPHVFGSTAGTRNQRCGALVITRDPAVAKVNARLLWGTGSASGRLRLGGVLETGVVNAALHVKDVRVVRSGTNSNVIGEAATPLELTFIDVEIDNASLTTNYRGSNVPVTSIYGATIENASGSVFATNTTFNRISRGVQLDAGAVAGVQFDRWQLIGCRFIGLTSINKVSTRNDDSGIICAFNKFEKIPGTASVFFGMSDQAASVISTSTGTAVVQNLFETTGVSSDSIGFHMSADSSLMSYTHSVVWNNTMAGFDIYGRRNGWYDESSGTNRRTHRLVSEKGNIWVRAAIKGDTFVGINLGQPAEAPFRTGNFAILHGAGLEGNLHQYRSDFSYEYYGRNSLVAATEGVRTDPLFTSDAAARSGPTAGAGGGTYTIQSGSPAIGMLSAELLPFDLAGNVRNRLSAGAYR